MIKVADYIAKKLADMGVRHVFMLTGGGAMFLNHAFGQEKRIKVIFNQHEQACAMAAEGYARLFNQLGVINVTTGPGGINSLNGVFGAWTDSIPMLVVSGQVKRETCMRTYEIPGLRQLGDQEADIIPMVKGITKYAITVTQPDTIRYHLERAYFLATHNRPGPCWLDIPIDIQSALVDETSLVSYDPSEDSHTWDRIDIYRTCQQIITSLMAAKRPVVLAGTGVRLSGAIDIFDRVIHLLGIPVTTAWTHDLIDSSDPLFCGRPGTIGERAGNFTVQNADLLLILGSRLNIRQVSYNWRSFAREAYKIWVDIDAAELQKPTIKADIPIQCDLKIFLEEFERAIIESEYNPAQYSEWLAWGQERIKKYPVLLDKHRDPNKKVNPYYFISTLFDLLDNRDVVVCGNATACIVPFQVAKIKLGQRMFSNSGAASMGYDLPAAIGAAVALNLSTHNENRRVICLAGDGSIQLNIQELQTVVNYNLPLKIFVLNNNGYLSIRTSQKNFFGSLLGESHESGVSFPNMVKIAKAYGIPAYTIETINFKEDLLKILNAPGAALIEVLLDPDQGFEPRMSSRQLPDGKIVSPSLEDLYPFLDRRELEGNMIVSLKED